jgi:3-dehydroquinate dehydratase
MKDVNVHASFARKREPWKAHASTSSHIVAALLGKGQPGLCNKHEHQPRHQ